MGFMMHENLLNKEGLTELFSLKFVQFCLKIKQNWTNLTIHSGVVFFANRFEGDCTSFGAFFMFSVGDEGVSHFECTRAAFKNSAEFCKSLKIISHSHSECPHLRPKHFTPLSAAAPPAAPAPSAAENPRLPGSVAHAVSRTASTSRRCG